MSRLPPEAPSFRRGGGGRKGGLEALGSVLREFVARGGIYLAAIGCAVGTPSSPAVSSLTPDPSRPFPDPLPLLAARVNGQPIPTRLVTLFIQKTRSRKVVTPEEKPAVYRQALEQCIDRELLFEEAVARGLSVPDQAVLAAFDQARVEHPDDEGWAKFLREQGLTADGYKAEIRTEKMVLVLLKQESDKIPPVSEAEIKAYFDENPLVFDSGPRIRARHILIPMSRLVTAQGKALTLQKRVDPVLKRLRSGEDFAKVAREVSTDAAASRGGDIGVVRRGQLAKALEDRAFELKPGEMTGAVETPAGYEILKVEEKLPDEKLAFEQARTRLQTLLWERKRDVAVQALVDSLRAKAKIERLF